MHFARLREENKTKILEKKLRVRKSKSYKPQWENKVLNSVEVSLFSAPVLSRVNMFS